MILEKLVLRAENWLIALNRWWNQNLGLSAIVIGALGYWSSHRLVYIAHRSSGT